MEHICIIAEAGVNHNGSVELAMKMVDAAKDAGADYVKFQTFHPEKLVSKFAQKAKYQKETTGNDESQLEMLKKLALSQIDFQMLQLYCATQKIGFLSTPFDLDSIDFLETLNMDFWKIPSGEITNLPYLEKIAKTGRKVVMSTGMSDLNEIQLSLQVLEKNGCAEVVLLHCNTQYPTPLKDVNLLAIKHLQEKFERPVGYSDHTVGIDIPIAAAALGAIVIEKHFTLDKTMEGPDHKASLEPDELKAMVQAVRNIEMALGNGKKAVSQSELGNKQIARKSIVAACNIKAGEVLSQTNVTVKRPGNGINPMRWYEVIGTKAIRDFREDELIEV